MEDILKIVEKLQGLSLLQNVLPHVDVERLAQSRDDLLHLHIEAQTYLMAWILQELRKPNKPLMHIQSEGAFRHNIYEDGKLVACAWGLDAKQAQAAAEELQRERLRRPPM